MYHKHPFRPWWSWFNLPMTIPTTRSRDREGDESQETGGNHLAKLGLLMLIMLIYPLVN
jgi:hypothetical protein